MQEFFDELMELRRYCSDRADELFKKFELPEETSPIAAIRACFNKSTIAVELTSHYMKAWDKQVPNDEAAARSRQQNGERLVILGQFLFIGVMSVCEFHAKQAVKAHPIFKIGSGRVYLGNILKESRDQGLISDEFLFLWGGVITLRNCIVHNNAIADEDANFKFSPELTLTLQKDKMTSGTIMTLVRVTGWVVQAYGDWCDAFVQLAKSKVK